MEARTAHMHLEIESLRALRVLARRSQEQIAKSLGAKQTVELKIECQNDLYPSTLR